MMNVDILDVVKALVDTCNYKTEEIPIIVNSHNSHWFYGYYENDIGVRGYKKVETKIINDPVILSRITVEVANDLREIVERYKGYDDTEFLMQQVYGAVNNAISEASQTQSTGNK